MFTQTQLRLASDVLETARDQDAMIATAESCTGGLIAALLTDVAGSSAVMDRGFVTYSNGAKRDMLEVRAETLDKYGAVSEEVAHQMARGALAKSGALYSVAVTGIAGPNSDDTKKPVGLVHIAVGASIGIFPKTAAHERCEFGDIGRSQVRAATVEKALNMLLNAMRAAV
ncbi:MAG: CinA family protein [Pseudomonadota bacterium]